MKKVNYLGYTSNYRICKTKKSISSCIIPGICLLLPPVNKD